MILIWFQLNLLLLVSHLFLYSTCLLLLLLLLLLGSVCQFLTALSRNVNKFIFFVWINGLNFTSLSATEIFLSVMVFWFLIMGSLSLRCTNSTDKAASVMVFNRLLGSG
jgi:hypothetical protein